MRFEVTSHGARLKTERIGDLIVTYNREWDSRNCRTVRAGEVILGSVARTPKNASYEYSALRADGVHKGAIQQWPDALAFLAKPTFNDPTEPVKL